MKIRTKVLIVLGGASFLSAFAADYIFKQSPNGSSGQISTGFRYIPNENYVGIDKLPLRLEDQIIPMAISVTPKSPVISGYFQNTDGSPFELDGTVIQARGVNQNGQIYNFDLVYGANNVVIRVIPVAPTRAIDIIGYPTAIIEGYPGN